ncbi:MAG: hypothetical protein LBE27_03785, partial [Deltaproteobacteria bacterium]|nr:hypothetical protein [Deltaproteobacteria bacterium]
MDGFLTSLKNIIFLTLALAVLSLHSSHCLAADDISKAKIVQVSAGSSHALALDSQGNVWVTGN